MTVLFADLVGFSTLAEHLDPEELRTLMTDTFGELTEEVEKREGSVEKFIGDAIVAIFGAPVTHENDPVRAVEAAEAMLEVVQRRSQAMPAPLELRIGVNSGLVVAGTVGDGTQTGVMGDAVNVAARLQQSADPGEILVAASTWRRVRDAFEAAPVGGLDVKGKTQPVETYRILGPREDFARLLAPFIGRKEELALLELLWSSVRKGNTHVVSVVGEPGVGKSRLLAEFSPREASLDLRIPCSGDRAFGPFLTLVERLLGGIPADGKELIAAASALGIEDEDALLLSPFLGLGDAPPVARMADETRERQVFAGVWQFLLAVSQDRPLFLAIDDAHWADESSRDLLDFLLQRLGGAPVMLVLSYRPGFEQIERAELRASHTAVRLEPLSPEESVALARAFLGVEELPADLEGLVAGRAEGNPFFIEELLQALLELGSLAVLDGRAVLAKLELEIPDTVQGTILARVDRLEPRERSMLQHAAVLGLSSSTELLAAVMNDGDISDQLDRLARAQLLVVPRPGEWAFKHALIQEVTYETLLLRQRRELHGKVAEALEQRAGDDPGLLEAMAEHYARADVPEKARRYAVAAGDSARERMGFAEAKRRYEAALRLWGEGDEEGRLQLLMKLGHASLLGGDPAGARTAFVEAEEGWREAGDPQRSGAALGALGRAYWVVGEPERATDVLERAISTLEPHGATPELAQAYTWASTQHMLLGSQDEAIELAEKGLVLAEQLGLDGLRAHLLNNLGSARTFLGDWGAVARIAEALELAKTAGDAEALGRAYANLSSTLWDTGRLPEALEVAREGREAMRRLGAPSFEWFIAGNEAATLADLGRLGEAEALVSQILGEHRSVQSGPGIVGAAMIDVLIRIRQGAYEDARQVLDEVLPLARRIGGSEFLSPLLLLEGQLEQARGNLAAARQAIREAVEIAFSTPSRAHWLRLLPDAARLLPAEESRGLLERVRDVSSSPLVDARRAEAAGVLARDKERSREAAELYRTVGMPYEEARCWIDAGEFERARDVVQRFEFAEGPLGKRLAAEAVRTS